MCESEKNYPADMDAALSQIRAYAQKNNVSPIDVGRLFSVGIVAARVIAPGLIGGAAEAVPGVIDQD
jgi:hypothetical protein